MTCTGRILSAVCFAFFSVFPTVAFAASTGFVQDMVAIVDTSVTEGEITQLTIDFINQEEGELTGKIQFYNRNELLGSRDLKLASMETQTFSIDWEASFGQHSFVAKAENLKLSGTSVTILGHSSESREIVIGFKNSSVAESLRDKGGFSAIVAGVIDELYDFVRPFAQTLNTWRIGTINPLEDTQRRIDFDKNEAEGKIKPILVVHGLLLSLVLFVVSHQIVFFSIVSILLILVVKKLFSLIRRIFRRNYDD